ncbi:MAG: hypothetical protein ABI718_16375 [Acidobacteriota bacterium]
MLLFTFAALTPSVAMAWCCDSPSSPTTDSMPSGCHMAMDDVDFGPAHETATPAAAMNHPLPLPSILRNGKQLRCVFPSERSTNDPGRMPRNLISHGSASYPPDVGLTIFHTNLLI